MLPPRPMKDAGFGEFSDIRHSNQDTVLKLYLSSGGILSVLEQFELHVTIISHV